VSRQILFGAELATFEPRKRQTGPLLNVKKISTTNVHSLTNIDRGDRLPTPSVNFGFGLGTSL
jgi:hypothetical protein